MFPSYRMYSRVTLAYSEEPQQKEALDEGVPSLMEAKNSLPAGNGDPACGSDENQEDACMDANSAGDSESRSIDLEYAESEGAPDEGLPSSIQGQAGDAPDVASADVQDDPFKANETDVQTHVPFGQGALSLSTVMVPLLMFTRYRSRQWS